MHCIIQSVSSVARNYSDLFYTAYTAGSQSFTCKEHASTRGRMTSSHPRTAAKTEGRSWMAAVPPVTGSLQAVRPFYLGPCCCDTNHSTTNCCGFPLWRIPIEQSWTEVCGGRENWLSKAERCHYKFIRPGPLCVQLQTESTGTWRTSVLAGPLTRTMSATLAQG